MIVVLLRVDADDGGGERMIMVVLLLRWLSGKSLCTA